MEEKGFRYVPYVRPEARQSEEERLRAAGDYAAMRVHRAFFGFGVFSVYVRGRAPVEPSADPNDKITQDRPEGYRAALNAAMAACLEEKGYEVADATPVALSTRGREAFADLDTRLGGAEPPPMEEGELFITIDWKVLTYEEAKPHLGQEIKAALDDLECGGEFYPAYQPRENAIERRTYDRYGTTPFPWASEEA
ncbi:hypothetical protein [Nonomuraea sp. SYSU D8015]|uniref:hypothetical protein n=1 Tax=Nonomuraea sp. SYSU D8015 TaxID=2593644 RepID=UPI00166017D3|nr:hypothetical protein [Nonomuraea sp. SYSU D8015]